MTAPFKSLGIPQEQSQALFFSAGGLNPGFKLDQESSHINTVANTTLSNPPPSPKEVEEFRWIELPQRDDAETNLLLDALDIEDPLSPLTPTLSLLDAADEIFDSSSGWDVDSLSSTPTPPLSLKPQTVVSIEPIISSSLLDEPKETPRKKRKRAIERTHRALMRSSLPAATFGSKLTPAIERRLRLIPNKAVRKHLRDKLENPDRKNKELRKKHDSSKKVLETERNKLKKDMPDIAPYLFDNIPEGLRPIPAPVCQQYALYPLPE